MMPIITEHCTVCDSTEDVKPSFLFDKKIALCGICQRWLEYNLAKAIETRKYFVEERLKDGKD